MADRPTGAVLIAEERLRQLRDEGFDADHDDRHCNGELAAGAIAYASRMPTYERCSKATEPDQVVFRDPWPWDTCWDNRSKVRGLRADLAPNGKPLPDRVRMRIRDLVKAGALIAAEIDRLQRIVTKTAK
jgi:hypothetical protein